MMYTDIYQRVLYVKWVHFRHSLNAFYIISVVLQIIQKKESGISCEAFIGVYDFCTLNITEVMINPLYLKGYGQAH